MRLCRQYLQSDSVQNRAGFGFRRHGCRVDGGCQRCFYGTTKNRVLALVQAMAVIAPMVAPVIGAFLLQFVSWRGTFGVLIAAGAVNLAASFF